MEIRSEMSNELSIFIGGASISKKDLAEIGEVWNASVFVAYGSTEAEPISMLEFKPDDIRGKNLH